VQLGRLREASASEASSPQTIEDRFRSSPSSATRYWPPAESTRPGRSSDIGRCAPSSTLGVWLAHIRRPATCLDAANAGLRTGGTVVAALEIRVRELRNEFQSVKAALVVAARSLGREVATGHQNGPMVPLPRGGWSRDVPRQAVHLD
jgi:hypothetical protein